MKPPQRTIIARLDDEEWAMFRTWCINRRVPIGVRVRELILSDTSRGLRKELRGPVPITRKPRQSPQRD